MSLKLTHGRGGYVVVQYHKDKEGYAIIQALPSLPIALKYAGAIIRYNASFFPTDVADRFFQELLAFDQFATHEINPYTKKDIARKTLQFGDPNVRVYKYSTASAKSVRPWRHTSCLQEMKNAIYLATGVKPNMCLINFYTPDAQLSYHSDDENDMVAESTVASVSLGTVRRFKMREKQLNADTPHVEGANMWTWMLAHGSLLTMEGKCQTVLEHSVPKMSCEGIRINCTFRVMKGKSCINKECHGELKLFAGHEDECNTMECSACNTIQHYSQTRVLTKGFAPWCELD